MQTGRTRGVYTPVQLRESSSKGDGFIAGMELAVADRSEVGNEPQQAQARVGPS